MLKKHFFCFLFFYILVSNIYAKEEISSFVLRNGLNVVLIKTKSPIVSQIVAYDVGAIEETSGKEGLAHLLEHVMFLGTAKYTKDDFSKTLQNIGAEHNAFTSFDKTVYYITAPKNNLLELIKLESSRMEKNLFNEQDIKNEIEVVLEERNGLYNSSYNELYFDIYAKAFASTNYGRSIIGYKDSFKKLTKEDVEAFYKTWYYPANAKLIIIGNIDLAKTKYWVEKYYGGISSLYFKPKRAKTEEEPLVSNIVLNYSNNNIQQDVLFKAFLVPSLNVDNSSNKVVSKSLFLLSYILNNKSFRLSKMLVNEMKVATEVSVSYDFTQKGSALLTFSVIPKEGVSLEVLENEFNKAIEILLKNPVLEKELQYSYKSVKADMEFLKEQELGYAMFLSNYFLINYSIKDINDLFDSLKNITLQDINNVFINTMQQHSVIAKARAKK